MPLFKYTKKTYNAMRRKTKVQRSARKGKPRSRAKARRPVNKPIKELLGAAGSAMFGPLGRTVANTAYDAFSHITGRGEYKISKNSIMDSTGPPRFNNGDGTVVIEHVEFVQDVYSSSEFTNQSYRINPGNRDLFPWLSNISHGWTTYEPLGLVVTFESLANTVSTSAGTGVVTIATNYDVTAKPYATMRNALASMFSTSGKPQENLIHPIECKSSSAFSDQLLIFNSEEAVREIEPLLTDLGLIQVMTEGMPSTGEVIGQIRLSYKIKLTKPQSQPLLSVSEYNALGETSTTTYPFGTILYPYSTNTLPVTVTNTGFVYFNDLVSGSFILEVLINFQSPFNLDLPVFTHSAGVHDVAYFHGSSSRYICNTASSALYGFGTYCAFAVTVDDGQSGQYIRFQANVPVTTATVQIIVRRVPSIPVLQKEELLAVTRPFDEWPGFADREIQEQEPKHGSPEDHYIVVDHNDIYPPVRNDRKLTK